MSTINNQVIDRCRWFFSLSANIERTYAVHYFAQLGITALGLCGVCFSIAGLAVLDDPAHTVHFCMCLVAMTMEILLPCYFGSRLADASQRLQGRVFASRWPERSVWFRRVMRVFVERAGRPILLRTTAGFFRIDLPTFVAVMRTAYTLLSFCSQLV